LEGALSGNGDESIGFGFAFPALETCSGSASRGVIFCIVRVRLVDLGQMLKPNNATRGTSFSKHPIDSSEDPALQAKQTAFDPSFQS
jgi:hypothetical protein